MVRPTSTDPRAGGAARARALAGSDVDTTDWPAQAADTIERVVQDVRSKTTGPAITAAKWFVAALFLLVTGITVTVLLIVMLLLNLGYFPDFWQRRGQTPGMRPFDLWVVRDQDGSAFGWGTALLRLVGLYVASAVFYLGFIWIFIDQRHRGWHDLIAGTVVIRRVGAAAR